MCEVNFKFMIPMTTLKVEGPRIGSKRLTTVSEIIKKAGHCGAGYGGGLGCPRGADPTLVFDINYNRKSWQRRLWDSLEAGVNINSASRSGFGKAADQRLRHASRILIKFDLRNVNLGTGRSYGSIHRTQPVKIDNIPALAKTLNGIVSAVETAAAERTRTAGILKSIIIYSDGSFDVFSGEPYSFLDFLGIIHRPGKASVFIPEQRAKK